MQQMHKWKDKVELTLDNRQIFFLFFGSSVVACFVFALGVMIGRQLDADERALQGNSHESIALLDAAMELELPMQFQEALQQPAERTAAQTGTAEETLADTFVADAGRKLEARLDELDAKEAAEPESKKPSAAKPTTKPVAQAPAPTAAKPAADSVLARGEKQSRTPAQSHRFTLQMKAFSNKSEADAFAAKLRANGHAARVESGEANGRTWYRVRMGAFTSWNEGIVAKEAFEKKESIIAYVVRIDS